jgi:epidermal growth factor receptor substrate 15
VAVTRSAHKETYLLNHSEQLPSPTAATDIHNINFDDVFGSSATAPATITAPAAPASTLPTAMAVPATPKGVFDDLDDDFEGLEDAKEGSADDDFATISRSGLEEFNPVFDSSPPPSQVLKSEQSSGGSQGGQNAFGAESSFDFVSQSTTSVAGSATAVAPPSAVTATAAAAGTKPGDSHDWDALFASLDEPAAPGTPDNGSLKEPTAAGNAARPAVTGRALTEEGQHDDPILKNLTGMGYARADALMALEKYDYNLERVSLHDGHSPRFPARC